MELGDIKTSLWGFRKRDVCDYLAEMSDMMSQRVEQEKTKSAQTEEALNARIEELTEAMEAMCRTEKEREEQNAALRQQVRLLQEENAAMRQRSGRAAGVLHDVGVLLADCAKAALPIAAEAVNRLRRRIAKR